MAIMVDKKPSFSGEGYTWECFSKNLSNDVVVYTHREVVDGDECDFALLIKNRGILIVEVKGWEAKYIFDVTNSGQVILTNDSPDEQKVYGSPRIQARHYRFQWLNYIQDNMGFSPVVLHMVCYPFISEKEYHDTKLDSLSTVDITLFKEDISSPMKLGQKIDNWFSVKKGVSSLVFDETYMALVRQKFEPSFVVSHEEVKAVSNSYSILKVYGRNFNYEDEDELIDAYFSGTKVIAFVHRESEIERLSERLQKELNTKKLIADHGNIRLAGKSEKQSSLNSNNCLRIFNFEIYLILEDFSAGEDICTTEGENFEQYNDLLTLLDENTGFNFNQYKIEHAPIDGNVLVRAGAGTGKTYSMVSRICFLNNTRKMAIYNLVEDIAMVTFTNEAADNMKKRLKQAFMSYFLIAKNKRFLHAIEAVDLMQISTIHKFAKSIIQSSSLDYGLGHDFSITSSAYAKEQIYDKYLNQYLEDKKESDSNIARKLRMPVYKFRELLMNFSKQLFDKSCDIKKIPFDEFGTFDELPFFNEVIQLVIIPAEEEYYNSVLSKNKIDLKECMILLNGALNGTFKQKCDLKYKFLFIDEFQDTDDIQIDSFLKLQDIITGMKLFIVGDIKQSIYRFRGATDSAFSLVQKEKTVWDEYSLITNYRTDNRLLSLFDEIFRRMGERGYLKYVHGIDSLDSNIETGIPQDNLIEKVEYSSDDEDAMMNSLFEVIDKQKNVIEALDVDQKLKDEERIIAILVRENWQIQAVLDESRKRGIFIETEIGGDLYKLAPAQDLYKLVLALLNPKNPIMLLNLIFSNYINVGFDVQALHSFDEKGKVKLLVDILDKYLMETCGKKWNDIVAETRVKPVLVLLRDIYEATQPWQNYSETEGEQRFYKSNYELTLEKIIKTYSVDYLTLNVIEGSLHINIVTGQEVLARNAEIGKNGIRVICTTIHKSKGLEYGTVILPYSSADISSMSKASLDVVYSDHKLAYGMKIDGPIKYYNSNYDTREERTQRIQEESRVLYVALTRAIRNVVWFKDTASNSPVSWQLLMEE